MRSILLALTVTLAPALVGAEEVWRWKDGRGVLHYSNAGHNYPLLRRKDGTLEELGVGGIMLGPIEDARYDQAEVAFAPGDGLLLYSDGISEAFDAGGGQFGEERLQETWRGCSATPRKNSLGSTGEVW